ncbi:MAG: hypothetical protein HOP04_01450 [Methylophilaceae bacterium]|nr:hypothetical protein [Methylophilaceae bacterium]
MTFPTPGTALHALDLLTLALASVQPQTFNLSRSRLISLNLVKDFVERHLSDSTLDTSMIATGVGLSPRYINDLFSDEDNSLMRFVWQRRLENCRKDMLNSTPTIATIGDRPLFNDIFWF